MKSLAVQLWPGPTPAPRDGLLALLLSSSGHRPAARQAVRLAAREALATLLAMAADDISIVNQPGEAPRVLLAGHPASIGCSFTHDDQYSLVAINMHGSVGADIMRIQGIPDWQPVARDYLGPGAAAALVATPDHQRAAAFTRLWTQREAALKCMGQQLSEWQAEIPGRTIALALPVPGLTGHLHIGDKNA